MRTMLSVLARTAAACSGNANSGGDDASPVDADLDPVSADGIYLDPVAGRADTPGTADAPWLGLADAIAAGLITTPRASRHEE